MVGDTQGISSVTLSFRCQEPSNFVVINEPILSDPVIRVLFECYLSVRSPVARSCTDRAEQWMRARYGALDSVLQRRANGRVRRRVASKWHSADRVWFHGGWMDRSEQHFQIRRRREAGVVVTAEQPPVLNRAAAATLLRILLRTADDNGQAIEASGAADSSVQS